MRELKSIFSFDHNRLPRDQHPLDPALAISERRSVLQQWAREVPAETFNLFKEQRVIEPEDKMPGLYQNGPLIFEITRRIGSGYNARAYLTNQNTVLKVIKKPEDARKQLLLVWATNELLPRYDIPTAAVFSYDPYGLWVEQEFIPFKKRNLEYCYSFYLIQPPDEIIRKVLELFEKSKHMAIKTGIFLDLKAANCIPRKYDNALVNRVYSD